MTVSNNYIELDVEHLKSSVRDIRQQLAAVTKRLIALEQQDLQRRIADCDRVLGLRESE